MNDKIMKTADRDYIKSLFSGRRFERLADAAIVGKDDDQKRLVCAFPSTGNAKQSFGDEIFALTHVERSLSEGRGVALDNDRGNIVAKFAGAEVEGQFIRLTIDFSSAESYVAARDKGTARILLKYNPTRWGFPTGEVRKISIEKLDLQAVSLCSVGYKAKVPRQRVHSITDEPVTQIRKIRFPGERPGNAKVDATARTATVEFVDTEPFSRPVDSEPICLGGDARLQPLVGKLVFPADNGVIVENAAPLARITEARWESDPPEIVDGKIKLFAHGVVKIAFEKSEAGNRELDAWVAGEKRGIAFTLKIDRSLRELEKQTYLHRAMAWTPISLALDGGTVITAEQAALAQPAKVATPSKPNLLQRVANAFTGGAN